MDGAVISENLASGRVTIDLGALAWNYRALRERATPATTAAVVKADAYGLGAAAVAPVLFAEGCRDFFVAHLTEALALRPALPREARIHVLNGLQPGTEAACADAGLIPVLNGREQVANWAALARSRGATLPAALQLDSGMSRLGLSPAEVAEIASSPAALAGIDVRFVMSHLAAADDPESPLNAAQLAALRRAAAAFPGAAISFGNSGGIFLGPDFRGALVRPGIALYGGAPVGGRANPMRPVVGLEVAVIQTRVVPAGTAVGYGGTLVTDREFRLATISAGYADGLPRSLSGRGAAWHDGVQLPFAGRVSMDSVILDVGALPEGALRLGSMVELIGPHQSLEDLAAAAGTISYEILTSLGRRYDRRYLPA